MTAGTPAGPEKFDDYADDYRNLVDDSITSSGESADYFSEYKIRCLLRERVPVDEPLLDFGAGIGVLTAKLVDEFDSVTAYEPSRKSLAIIRERVPAAAAVGDADRLPDAGFSTAIASGVLHHVPPAERLALLSRLRTKLRPGGRLFVFEHNPVNPLTRRAVALCPFDDDAVLLWPRELRALLRRAGYRLERLDYIVFFPRFLAPLRPLEPALRRLGIGAQTLTIATNPG